MFNWTAFEKPLIFIFVFLITLVAGHVCYALLRRVLESRLGERNAKFLARLGQYAVFASGLYLAVYHILRLDFHALAASMGIISIAIAFSSQQLAQNVIAGVLIGVKRPIWYEDWVEIGTSGLCKVRDVSLTQTVLRSVDGRLLYFPNAMLLSAMITNYTKAGFIEVPVTIAVAPGTDLDRVRELAMAVADAHPQIFPKLAGAEKAAVRSLFQLPDVTRWLGKSPNEAAFLPNVLVTEVTSAKVTLSIRVWIRHVHLRSQIVSEFLTALVERVRKEQIELK